MAPGASVTLMMEQMAEDPRLRLKRPSIRVEGGKKGVALVPHRPHTR
jgi:hypothetical protein